MKIQGVRVMETRDNIKIIRFCDWLDITYGKEKRFHIDYKKSGRQLKIWCVANDATHYSAPRNNYFIPEAVNKAKKEGKSVVVVEDLS